LPPRRCDDTWPASHWRTSSATRAIDHQAADGTGIGLSVGVVDVVLLIFPSFLVVILFVGVFLIVRAFDDQRVVFFLVVLAFVLIFVFVLEFLVIVLGFVFVGGGGSVLLVEEVEVFECQVAGGFHGASPW
jgi:hypothetical protein